MLICSLSQEVMDRRNLQSLLGEFLGQLRASSDRYVETVHWLKQKLDKLQKERQEVRIHGVLFSVVKSS